MKRVSILLGSIVPVLVLFCVLYAARVQATAPVQTAPHATFTVNTTTDATDANPGDGHCETAPGNGICTLRAAVQEANALPGADAITVPAGHYDLTISGADEDHAATGDLDIREELTITGDRDVTTVIDANREDRVFHILGVDASISDLTVTKGDPDDLWYSGGGIYNGRDEDYHEGALTLSNVYVKNNHVAGWGGGILSLGPLTVTNSIITDNVATGNGGGIRSRGTLYLHDTTVYSNAAGVYGAGISALRIILKDSVVGGNSLVGDTNHKGGGLHVAISALIEDSAIGHNTLRDGLGGGIFIGMNANVTITHSIIWANAARTDDGNTGTRGGGIYNESNQTVTISDTVIYENLSYHNGGGIYHDPFSGRGEIYLHRVSVNQNQAQGSGAGIYNNGDMHLVNATISGNQTFGLYTQWGGGIHHRLGTLTVTNSTIAHNEAQVGGAIYASTSVTLENSIMADNTATGLEPGDATTHNCFGAVSSAGYNLEDGTDCNFSAPGDLSGTDPQLLPLVAYYGVTAIHPLDPYSPAIDRIPLNVNGCGLTITTDQHGAPRPRDGDDDGTAQCDVGAYEAPRPILSINKHGPTLAPAGEPIVYALNVTNNLPFTLSDLVITDAIPIGSTYVSGGTQVGDVVRWTPATLGSRQTITRFFTVTATETITNYRYRVSSSEGYSATGSTAVVTAVETPISNLAAANDSPTTIGQATALTATVSAGANVTYTWSLGDGATTIGPIVSHTYPSPGAYTAVVTAANQVSSAVTNTIVTIRDQPITALQASGDSPTPLGAPTTLTAAVASGTNVAYSWNLGDGAFGSGATIEHVYPAAGVYTATVTATNSVGQLTATTTITVDEPISGLTASSDSPTALGATTTFSATLTTGSNVAFSWDFGDGHSATGMNPTHSYTATGAYSVTVTAENSVSAETATINVLVVEPDQLIYLPVLNRP